MHMKKFKPPRKKKIMSKLGENIENNTLLSFNFFMKPEDILSEKYHLSDEELYYIALSISDMETRKHQRAMIDLVHFQCDEDSILRFMVHFSDDLKGKIMYTC